MGRVLRKAILLGGSAGGPIGGTWNPARKAAGTTLSNGNLTAQGGAGAYQSTFGTVGRSVGRWSFKVTIDIGDSSYPAIGFGNASPATNNYLGYDGNSIGLYADGSINYNYSGLGAPIVSTGVHYTTGDVIEAVLDKDAGVVYFKKNGVLIPGSQVAVAGMGGAVFPAIGFFSGAKGTANFTS